eukprot:4318861-Pyramimonas_sp.AAC.1
MSAPASSPAALARRAPAARRGSPAASAEASRARRAPPPPTRRCGSCPTRSTCSRSPPPPATQQQQQQRTKSKGGLGCRCYVQGVRFQVGSVRRSSHAPPHYVPAGACFWKGAGGTSHARGERIYLQGGP